jgi:AmiR/NasT family two-component response regulator
MTAHQGAPSRVVHRSGATTGMSAGPQHAALVWAARYRAAVLEAEQLREAMRSRAVIEQAKGVLMARRRCSPDEAFDVLREVSQTSNTKLREVARALVDEAVACA